MPGEFTNCSSEVGSTAEAFYRFHVTPNFAITPDIQVQVHPALNPAENALWVFSLRARLVF